MNRTWCLGLVFFALGALAFCGGYGEEAEPTLFGTQNQLRPFDDVYQRPQTRLGYSPGIGAGTALPTVANSNEAPRDAEQYAVITDGATANPEVYSYSSVDADWEIYTKVPNANVTESQFWLPGGTGMAITAAEAEDALAGDLDVVCYRAFLPFHMTVTEAVVYEMQVASAGSSDYIGVAIYEDADAGVQLTEGASVFASDGAALVIDLTDVSLDPDWYRICASQNDVSAHDWMAVAIGTAQAAINDDTVGSEATWAKAANDSTGNADMPATTGALTATAEAMPLIRLQTN